MPLAMERSPQWMVAVLQTRAGSVGSVFGALCVVFLFATGAMTRLEQRVSDAWFSISDMPPTGRTVIVPVDRAIAEGGNGIHFARAALADLLLRLDNAGASRILIALNLAGKTTLADDVRLRNALTSLGAAKVGLARPTVVSSSRERPRWGRIPVDDQFAELVTPVASDLALDSDAMLRYDGLSEVIVEPLPSAAVWLAGRAQNARQRFRINFGINLSQIPVVDAYDILAHDFQPELKGALVIIGSYSSALGYGIRAPRYGELRRVQVMALASETVLLQHRLWTLPPIFTTGVLVLFAAGLGIWGTRMSLLECVGALLGISLCSIALGANLQIHYGLIVPSAGLVAAALSGFGGARITRRLHHSAQVRRNEIEILQVMATRDSLTNLLNRLSFERELAKISSHSKANVAVFLCDLDGFKQVNDTFGHHAGDLLLGEVARRIVNSIGDKGIAARLGGDEFALLLMDVTADEAVQAARDIIKKVSDPITVSHQEMNVGISIGVAMTGLISRPEDLLSAADEAMYQAKRSRSGYSLWQPHSLAA